MQNEVVKHYPYSIFSPQSSSPQYLIQQHKSSSTLGKSPTAGSSASSLPITIRHQHHHSSPVVPSSSSAAHHPFHSVKQSPKQQPHSQSSNSLESRTSPGASGSSASSLNSALPFGIALQREFFRTKERSDGTSNKMPFGATPSGSIPSTPPLWSPGGGYGGSRKQWEGKGGAALPVLVQSSSLPNYFALANAAIEHDEEEQEKRKRGRSLDDNAVSQAAPVSSPVTAGDAAVGEVLSEYLTFPLFDTTILAGVGPGRSVEGDGPGQSSGEDPWVDSNSPPFRAVSGSLVSTSPYVAFPYHSVSLGGGGGSLQGHNPYLSCVNVPNSLPNNRVTGHQVLVSLPALSASSNVSYSSMRNLDEVIGGAVECILVATYTISIVRCADWLAV